MRALVTSIKSIGCTVASRTDGLAQACATSIANLRRTALRSDRSVRTRVASIMRFRQTVASRAARPVQGYVASIVNLGRTLMSRAQSRAPACAAPIIRVGQAVAFHTEGVRAQVCLAFTVSFVVAMAAGSLILSPGARQHRPAPTLVQAEPTVGSPAVTPSVEPLPAQPSVALPSLPEPSKGGEEDVRLVTASSAGHPQATSVAVRSSGSARNEVARVTEIALWGSSSKPWVSITASAPVRHQLRNVEPNWVVIDISRAELALASGRPPAGRGLVRLIRVGQFTPGVVRVVLELTQAVPVHVATSPGKNAIVVSLAVDAGGNSHSVPAPRQQPGVAKAVPMARAVSPVPGT